MGHQYHECETQEDYDRRMDERSNGSGNSGSGGGCSSDYSSSYFGSITSGMAMGALGLGLIAYLVSGGDKEVGDGCALIGGLVGGVLGFFLERHSR